LQKYPFRGALNSLAGKLHAVGYPCSGTPLFGFLINREITETYLLQ
jgi:hypothetical protein